MSGPGKALATRDAAPANPAAGFDFGQFQQIIGPLTDREVAARVPEDKLRSALQLAREYIRANAPRSLVAHAAYIHRTDTGALQLPARHHGEWVRVLEDRERFPFVCIVAPPGYAKSTWASVAYPTWRIGESHGTVRLGLISNTARQAEGFAGAIHQAIQTKEFQSAYPDVRLDEVRGSGKTSFYVTGCPPGPNPSLLATGIGGPVLGKRFDEIIVDDPITWDDARSQVVMQGLRQWFKTTLVTRLPTGKRPPHGKGGRIVVICTRWSEHDLIPLLGDLGFKIITMPALGWWDRTAKCPDCEQMRAPDLYRLLQRCEHCDSTSQAIIEYGNAPLWPETESFDYLQKERFDDELIFELVKQGNPKVLSGDTFDPDWFQRAPLPPLGEFDSVVMGVDTAGGKDRQKGDYFCVVTMGSRGAEEWVIDVFRDRIPAPEQEAKIREIYARFQDAGRAPDLVNIEDANEGRAVYQHLEVESRLPLKLSMPEGDKEFRAIPLSNAYRARRVFHAQTDERGRSSKWGMAFEAELESFPDVLHDDQVDAAVWAYFELRSSQPRVRVLG